MPTKVPFWSTVLPTTLAVLLAFGSGCSDIDRTIPDEDRELMARRAAYGSLGGAHRLELGATDEPGQRLVVLGRLVRQETGRPVAEHPVQVYQADHAGRYGEAVPGDESTARLGGTVRTDSAGRFLLSTILPGDYGDTADNRHIHLGIAGARPEAYDFYIRQYLNRGMQAWARGTDQAIVLDLRAGTGDTLVALGEVVVRGLPAP
jgi:protocatechuate 3,4-dioxygenase beta subunit